ncbi:MAG: serine/threonine protein kinase [Candidatus Thiodiazotropha sp. (ex Notomyrtea botanica)]|nr:serine/threonine protein kinase [Candidatus Thiodiazotropha sp. (ex Notomyrtea botanica)]
MFKTVNTAELSFQLGDEIGHEGRNSKVYIATDIQLDAEIVVKKIPKADFSDVDEYFLEASLLYLSSHPNVVPIHYGCQDDEYIYVSMPHYSQGSLKTRMASGSLSVREIIVYSTQISSGLHNIHSKGLIHFDVKPDNILLSDRGEALVADFGLAKQTSYTGIAGQDRMYGKMVPPEAFQTDEFNSQFDIYQIGLTMHRMCVGDEVFYAEHSNFVENGTLNREKFRHAVVNGQFPNTNQYPEHIPQKIIDTIRKCLARDLNDRFTSAIKIVNELAEIDGNLLDWKLNIVNNSKIWTKVLDDGRQFQLEVRGDNSSHATRISAQGNQQRITNYCKTNLQRSETKRFLRDH